MFGIRFIKTQPTTHLLQYQKGQLIREGRGLSFFYFSPFTALVAIPMESVDVPFIFEQITADFQEVSIQGQVTYRITDPKKISELLNFTLDSYGQHYASTDPQKLPQRIINLVQVLMQGALRGSPLREALPAADRLVKKVFDGLTTSKEVNLLGLEILGLSILAIKPNPETARALEADIREKLLKEADEAIYARRNAAVEQERAIKENELDTEIAVENKKRQIQEAQMEAEKAVQQKRLEIQETDMNGRISLEKLNKELVALATENLKQEAETRAYGLTVTMQALAGVDAKMLQALASMNMNPGQLMALAFRDIADSAEKIGQLNVTPDLLKELLQPQLQAQESPKPPAAIPQNTQNKRGK